MSNKYVGFLRGINVGIIRIKMADLANAFRSMGCNEIKTYLQSGNVVFESELHSDSLKPIIEKGLSDTFQYKAYILIRNFDIMKEIVAHYPFVRDEGHHAYVIFVEDEDTLEALKDSFFESDEENKNIKFADKLIYWKSPVGESTDTPFAKILSKVKYKSKTTTRNIKTLEKIVLDEK